MVNRAVLIIIIIIIMDSAKKIIIIRLSCRSGCLIHNGTCIRVSRVDRVSRVRVTLPYQ